jgi:PhnB protein
MEEKQAGEKIRSLRERKAWTQEHLASAARISPRTVQRAEEGAMSAETRTAIAGALDVPVETLAPARKPPEGSPRITPIVPYEDSTAAVAWLERAFGFRTREKMTGVDGQVLHAELVLGDGVIMVGHVSSSPRWASPRSVGKTTQALYVFVDDLDAHYRAAVEAGARIVTEPEISYGQRRYRALDLEGHEWCFSVAASAAL